MYTITNVSSRSRMKTGVFAGTSWPTWEISDLFSSDDHFKSGAERWVFVFFFLVVFLMPARLTPGVCRV